MSAGERTGIVLRLEEKGESFWSMAFLSENEGLEYLMLRRSRRRTRPDLFDTARVRLSSGKREGPQFPDEYHVLRRRAGIGKSIERIRVASRFAEVLRRNARHLPDPGTVFPVCERFFDAAADGVSLEAAYLKSLYLFAAAEGFPVKEDWATALPAPGRRDLASVLRTPLRDQQVSPERSRSLAGALESWLVREAHFSIDLPPGLRSDSTPV